MSWIQIEIAEGVGTIRVWRLEQEQAARRELGLGHPQQSSQIVMLEMLDDLEGGNAGQTRVWQCLEKRDPIRVMDIAPLVAQTLDVRSIEVDSHCLHVS